jgi:NhaA family Na+:H+ antiporter
MTAEASDSRPTNPFQEFFRTEAAGGALLVACACAALVVANSGWADAYHRLLATPIAIAAGGHALSLTFHQWINDGLMAVFFLLVGLEIKREALAGELASPRQAALPIAAAIGGMVVPASIYLLTNGGGIESRGWAIPMATDIAFALGVLALVAPRAPSGLKIFLTALAIVDDMGAVLVIALFYTGAITWGALGMAGLILLLLIALNVLSVRRLTPYLVLGLGLWFFVHESGVHATIAGVLLAFAIPTRTRINATEFSAKARGLLEYFDRTETGDLLVLTSKGQQEAIIGLERASEGVTAPLLRLEHALHGFSAFVVMPLFAFSNAGVGLSGSSGGERDRCRDLGTCRWETRRDYRCGAGGGSATARRSSRWRQLDSAARVRLAGRHRIHDVAVHRHAGLSGYDPARLGQSRNPRRIDPGGYRRRPRRTPRHSLSATTRRRVLVVCASGTICFYDTSTLS